MLDKNIITMNEKDNKNGKEKTLKFRGVSEIFQCHQPWLDHICATGGYTMIPRVATTNIRVFPIHIDMHMEIAQRSRVTTYRHGNSETSSRHMTNTYQYHEQRNLLHAAAYNGNVTRVRELVQGNNELICSLDSQGNIPLHLAMEKGHNNKEVALYLIMEFPQGSLALNHIGKSPLYLGVVNGHKDLVDYMLEHFVGDFKHARSIIFDALATPNNDQERVQIILKHQPKLIKCTNKEGWTPLSYAAYNDLTEIVGLLLEKFSKSIIQKDSSYPIHKACLGGHVAILKLFYSHSPKSFTKPDPNGLTVLHHAAKEPNNKLKDVVSYLLSLQEISRTLVKSKDETNRTPLNLARSCRNDEVVQLLPE